jgi:hypothetical protein
MRLGRQVERLGTAIKLVFRPILKRDLLQIVLAAWLMASLAGIALAWSNTDATTGNNQASNSSQEPASLGQTMTEDSTSGTTNNLSLQVNHSGSGTNVTNSTSISSSSSNSGSSSSTSKLTVNGQNVPIPANGSVRKSLDTDTGSVDISVDNNSISSNNSSLNINVESNSSSDNAP